MGAAAAKTMTPKAPHREHQHHHIIRQDGRMITINNRDKIDWHEGLTISDAFSVMGYDYALITVTVNDEFIPEEEYETRVIPDEANVLMIHLAHGG
jgi:thiamine biosynthesis protein ThiS